MNAWMCTPWGCGPMLGSGNRDCGQLSAALVGGVVRSKRESSLEVQCGVASTRRHRLALDAAFECQHLAKHPRRALA